MLTDDDLKAIEQMMATLLETYGLKKPPSSAAIRMQRYRERVRNAASRGRNKIVTRSPAKRNGASQGRNGASHPAIEQIVIEHIPLNNGDEFGVTDALVKELEAAYPVCDVPQTLKEIRVWCIANPQKRKTRWGVTRFINSWMARIQDKG
jgi:hypothetical protein